MITAHVLDLFVRIKTRLEVTYTHINYVHAYTCTYTWTHTHTITYAHTHACTQHVNMYTHNYACTCIHTLIHALTQHNYIFIVVHTHVRAHCHSMSCTQNSIISGYMRHAHLTVKLAISQYYETALAEIHCLHGVASSTQGGIQKFPKMNVHEWTVTSCRSYKWNDAM